MDEEDDWVLSRSSSKKLTSNSRAPIATDGSVDIRYQAASYALEVLSGTFGTRLHSLGIIFRGDKMSLWYYDASGVVRTASTLSLIDDFEVVAAIIIAIGCCDGSRFGFLPSILELSASESYPKDLPPRSLEGYSVDLSPQDGSPAVAVTLNKPIFTQYSLVGRRTFVYDATTNVASLADKEAVVKFSLQVKTRKPENELLEIARRAGVRHLPELHLTGDLFTPSDGIRYILEEQLEAFHEGYEDRVLRALVFTRYKPLRALFSKTSEHLKTMVKQMLECECVLYFIFDFSDPSVRPA